MVDSLLGQYILCIITAMLLIAAWQAKSEACVLALYTSAIVVLYVAFLMHLWLVLLLMLMVAMCDFALGDKLFGKKRRGLWEDSFSHTETQSDTPS